MIYVNSPWGGAWQSAFFTLLSQRDYVSVYWQCNLALEQPATLRLRFLQALAQLDIDKNDIFLVPMPIDLLT
jgi:hypothetical protein